MHAMRRSPAGARGAGQAPTGGVATAVRIDARIDVRPRDARPRARAAPPGRPPRRTGHAPPCRTHTVLHRTRSVLRCLAAHRRRAARNRCDRPPSRVASRFTTVGTALA
ncbi:hypothetical protein Y034_6108 [Burkholderia pseudomallei MSHR449]|nr:hypothetical protein Y034_6108 [Burkholderia pseudomallei MSHR449]